MTSKDYVLSKFPQAKSENKNGYWYVYTGISPLALSMAKTEQKAWDDAAKNIGYKSDKNEL
jgi:hypothetical protein